MQHIVIEESSILIEPEFLTIQSNDIKIYASTNLNTEVEKLVSTRFKKDSEILNIINLNNIININSLNIDKNQLNQDDVFQNALQEIPKQYFDIAYAARFLKNKYPQDTVYVSTKYWNLHKSFDKICDMSFIPELIFKPIRKGNISRDTALLQVVKDFKSKRIYFKWIKTSINAILTISLFLLVLDFELFVGIFTNIYFVIFALPLIILAVFWYRSHSRLQYGFFEIIFGIIVLYLPFGEFLVNNNDSFDLLKLFSGVFIIIRGLDNIDKYIKSAIFKTKFMTKWTNVFK